MEIGSGIQVITVLKVLYILIYTIQIIHTYKLYIGTGGHSHTYHYITWWSRVESQTHTKKYIILFSEHKQITQEAIILLTVTSSCHNKQSAHRWILSITGTQYTWLAVLCTLINFIHDLSAHTRMFHSCCYNLVTAHPHVPWADSTAVHFCLLQPGHRITNDVQDKMACKSEFSNLQHM